MHVFDPATHFCTRCGRSFTLLADLAQRECCEADNVIAISHVLARRAGGFMVEALERRNWRSLQ